MVSLKIKGVKPFVTYPYKLSITQEKKCYKVQEKHTKANEKNVNKKCLKIFVTKALYEYGVQAKGKFSRVFRGNSLDRV